MKLDRLEHYDKFFDEYSFWLDISDLPEEVQAKAREIAKEDYDPEWFGVCVGCDGETDGFYLVTDRDETGEPCTVYYIDRDGDKHWFPCEIPPEFLEQVFAECSKALAQENEAQKPSVIDAIQNAKKTAADRPAPDKAHTPPQRKADKGAR